MGAEKVLNINDSEASRFAITRMLQHAGFEVVEAESGLQGVELSKQVSPDVILLDVKLPDIDGFEVCRRIKSDPENQFTPILHITAHALSTSNKVQSLEDGADAYLTFPVDRTYLIAMVRSLIRLKRAEKQREDSMRSLDEKNRELTNALDALRAEKEMKEKFVATVSHDLRNPLAVISLSAHLATKQADRPELIRSQLDRIIHTTDRADQMIQDILDSSLLRAGQKLPVRALETDLRRIAEDALEELKGRFGDRFVLKAPEVLNVRWDPRAIRRMLENLLQNAIKYGAADQKVTLTLSEMGDTVRIGVHNWGNPISAEDQKVLFDPFTRSQSARIGDQRGWGLGLTLVLGVVDAHGGSIEVDSLPERGTTFQVDLPREIASTPGLVVQQKLQSKSFINPKESRG
jgi:signal transduction histidine kinase